MRLPLGHWLLAGLLAVAFHAAILVGWRTPVSSMTATPRGPVVEMATSLAGIMGQAAQVAEMRPPETTREVEQPVEKVVDPLTPDAISDQMPFEVAATAPFVIPRELNAAEPLPMVTPTEVPVLEAMPPTLKPVQPKKTTETKPKELKEKPPPKKTTETKPKELKEKPPPKKTTETKPKELKQKPPPKELKTKKVVKEKKAVKQQRTQRAVTLGNSKRGQGGKAKKVRRASTSTVRSYGRRVRTRILRRARGGAGSGTAVVTFGISSSGQVRYARISRSSGKSKLDRRALAAVRGSFPKPPKGANSGQLNFSIAISFR